MSQKQIDNRICSLIESGIKQGHRSMFVVIGDNTRNQVAILHTILSRATIKSRPNVLWCSEKDLVFFSHRVHRMKKINGRRVFLNEDEPFEQFIHSNQISYCSYAETHKILGNTFGMCIIQDFEALTPNIIAQTIGTVEGGGLVVFLLRTINSIKQLHTIATDIHARHKTEAHQDVGQHAASHFHDRFILSLASCHRCLVVDDRLNILPISSHSLEFKEVQPAPGSEELKELKSQMRDAQPVSPLLNCCVTCDQAKVILKFVEVISDKTSPSTLAITAARGRGKSAALGLSVAAAVAMGYSNIFVTGPRPQHLKTLFEFLFKGLNALGYGEHEDYTFTQSPNPNFNKAVVRVDVFRDNRQTIQYIQPTDAQELGQADLVVIDEAAAIPLPWVKALLGPYLVFMTSTVNGYEGRGRWLSLRLIEQLRVQSRPLGSSAMASTTASDSAQALGRTLVEVSLNESVRYRNGDAVESWLDKLLCLDATSTPLTPSGCPSPSNCDVDCDALFSFHKASEAFLRRVEALMVS